ncbi:MAG: hypothetical protein U7123_24130 [Potamolinea sp.]
MDFGFWILDFGFWILDFGLGILDWGFWIGIGDFSFLSKFLLGHQRFSCFSGVLDKTLNRTISPSFRGLALLTTNRSPGCKPERISTLPLARVPT